MKQPITFLLIAGAILTLACHARADIYRHVDEDGVERFTDAPVNGNYALFMKEEKTGRTGKRLLKQDLVSPGSNGSVNKEPALPHPADELVLPVRGRITSLTGLRIDPLDGKLRHHNGVDIAVTAGTPVKPVSAGTVTFSGMRAGYGNTVIVDHNDGTMTLYAHNSENMVRAGDLVDRSTIIALTGSTGRTTGPHLHFEAWQNGVNVTRSYVPGADGPATALVTEPPVHRILQPDGTILFTNLR